MFKEYLAYIRDNPEGKWFKRKLYGWGWTPVRWQGWVTLIVFVILIAFNAARSAIAAEGGESPFYFLAITIILVATLIFICYKKGEKPHWQWGIPDKYKQL